MENEPRFTPVDAEEPVSERRGGRVRFRILQFWMFALVCSVISLFATQTMLFTVAAFIFFGIALLLQIRASDRRGKHR